MSPEEVAAVYARYSTDLQDPSSIEDQVALAKRVGAKNCLTILPNLIFPDYAESGRSMLNRPGLLAMLAAARNGEFKTLIVEKMSRLARDTADTQSILREFTFLGITIVDCHLGRGLDKLSATVMGLAADLQRTDTADMVRRGLDSIVRAGATAGGRPYGYESLLRGSKKRGGDLAIVSAEADIIREIFDRYAHGESPRDIAGDLNSRGVAAPRGQTWTASTINGWSKRGSGLLNNALYRGEIVWNKNEMRDNPLTGKRVSRPNSREEWVRSPALHLRIVAEDVWKKVQQRREEVACERPHTHRRKNRVFSGRLRCGACGGGMSIKGQDKTGRVRIQCTIAKESGTCPDPRSYYVDDIESRALSRLQHSLGSASAIQAFIDEYAAEAKRLSDTHGARRAQIERELSTISARITRMNDMLINGIGDPVRTNARLQDEMTAECALREELDTIQPPAALVVSETAQHRYLDTIGRVHEVIGPDGEGEAAQLLRNVIDKVIIRPTGRAANRHTPQPEIEVMGRLDVLLADLNLLSGGKVVAEEEHIANL